MIGGPSQSVAMCGCGCGDRTRLCLTLSGVLNSQAALGARAIVCNLIGFQASHWKRFIMAMIPFYTKFPDLAFRETRSITVRGRTDLPDGEYGFLEFYCDEVDCDCRRVIVNVLSPVTGAKVWATINYGWESLEFYERWMRNKEDAVGCKGPSLDPLNPQTPYSPVLLRLFEFILKDAKYVERLKRHYELFKRAVAKESGAKRQRKYRRKRIRKSNG